LSRPRPSVDVSLCCPQKLEGVKFAGGSHRLALLKSIHWLSMREKIPEEKFGWASAPVTNRMETTDTTAQVPTRRKDGTPGSAGHSKLPEGIAPRLSFGRHRTTSLSRQGVPHPGRDLRVSEKEIECELPDHTSRSKVCMEGKGQAGRKATGVLGSKRGRAIEP
jgi:hypothetical protein